MARNPRNADANANATPSLLDRLVDREPELASDPSTTRAQSIRLLKAGLRRDLEWLLNSRRTPEAAPESMKELAHSVYNYGVPDFSGVGINSSRDRHWLTLELETAVARFEPRLRDVRVSLVENPEANQIRLLRFQIEGLLMMDPAPEVVSFDTVLQLTNGEYQVRGDRGA